MRPKLLLIEDAVEYQKIVTATLGQTYDVTCAGTAEDALLNLAKENFQIILVDVGLPGRDGLSLCHQLREDARLIETPIILVTGRTETTDVVSGFEAGADDYIQKPFRPEELRARVDSRLKRATALALRATALGSNEAPDKFSMGELRFSVGIQRVSLFSAGVEQPIDLTPNEFKILYYLARSEGKTRSRDEILKEVWGAHMHVVERTVDKHVCALRRKMGSSGRFVLSIAGEGYRFDAKALEMPSKRVAGSV